MTTETLPVRRHVVGRVRRRSAEVALVSARIRGTQGASPFTGRTMMTPVAVTMTLPFGVRQLPLVGWTGFSAAAAACLARSSRPRPSAFFLAAPFGASAWPRPE